MSASSFTYMTRNASHLAGTGKKMANAKKGEIVYINMAQQQGQQQDQPLQLVVELQEEQEVILLENVL
jgi:hypothetical protein